MKYWIDVKLVTPGIIGGAQRGELDSLNWLRPTEIRGMLRYWTRAIVGSGGAGLNYQKIDSEWWGSTESAGKIKITCSPAPVTIDKLPLFPNKEGKSQSLTNMFIPDNNGFLISFLISDCIDINRFKCILWVWLHLGSIGKRSRRSYGSLLWASNKNDLLIDFFDEMPEQFDSLEKLNAYLKTGLDKVKKLWGTPSNSSRVINNFFKLNSYDQIFIGTILQHDKKILTEFTDSKNGLLHKVHGFNFDNRIRDIKTGNEIGINNEQNELGFTRGRNNRLASPMMWRLYPVGEGYVPVMTWSPRYVTKLAPNTGMYNYLTNTLGFDRSLAGRSLTE